MQRWFRFSGTIALVSLLSSGFPLLPAAYAEGKGGPSKITQKGETEPDAEADSDTALEGFDPHDLPAPKKHQLRPTPLQIANHRIMRLNERIVAQNNRIAHLEGVLAKREEQAAAQEGTVKELQEAVTKGDARLQAMFEQIATVSRQVEGLETHQANQAARLARAAQQSRNGRHLPPGGAPSASDALAPSGLSGLSGGPAVQTTPPGNAAPIPRALPVEPQAPAAPAKPEPTVEPPPEGSIVYEVKPGDNLTRIARAHSTSVAEILKFNKITDERKLQIGQELHIPPSTAPSAPASPTPTATPALP